MLVMNLKRSIFKFFSINLGLESSFRVASDRSGYDTSNSVYSIEVDLCISGYLSEYASPPLVAAILADTVNTKVEEGVILLWVV